ncbi:MAG TPA: hypothetical protein PLN21_18600 [Gemmatales bacterium]|nr:hypothetical protein [Gemmatales bacterium]
MKWQKLRAFICDYEDDERVELPYKTEVAHIAQRFTAKLQELDFQTPGYHDIYVKTLSTLRHEQIAFHQAPEAEIICLQAGIDPTVINQLYGNNRDDYLVRLLAKCLKAVCKRDGLDFSKVKTVEKLLLQFRTKLESLHLGRVDIDLA